MLCAGATSNDELRELSDALGYTLPSEYESFIRRYGGAMVGSLPIYGVRPSEVMGDRDTVVEVNRRFREDQWPGVGGWLIISVDGSGNPLGLATDGRLMVSNLDSNTILAWASSFDDFLVQQLDEAKAG
jgi:hypothetical protein